MELSTSAAPNTPDLKRPLEEGSSVSTSAKRVKLKQDATVITRDAAEPVTATESEPRSELAGNKTDRLKKGKEKERRDRRRGTRGRSRDGESEETNEPKEPRLPKRQCALLIGFCGSGYNGMQIQPDPKLRTIEGVLFNSLVKVGAVSKDNANDPVKVNLGRAARTDAGVHAAGNVVSMKLITAIPGVPDLVARVNEELPPEIRLWSVLRVQNAFNARTTCDSRKYTYFFPSYLMIPPKPGSGLHQTLAEGGSESAPLTFWSEANTKNTRQEDLQRKRDYRMPQDLVNALRETARKFEGSHNFHNFTVGRDFRDRSCVRHIKNVQIADPVVYGATEWVSVLFHGQSFMLHQRKMMAALVLACRTGSLPQLLDELYGPRMVFIPKMPALGLLLEHPVFDTYTKKISSANEKLKPEDPEYRHPIDFELHREAIEQFKQEHIYSRMRSIEEQEGVFDAWIRSIDSYSGNDLLYLNSRGIIPASAVIKKGERRNNPFREKRRFDATTSSSIDAESKRVGSEEDEDEEDEEILDKARLDDMEG